MTHDDTLPDETLPDGALLTAYALGELDGDDLARAESLLSADPAARRAVDRTRAEAADLERLLADEPAPVLTAAQRERIAAASRRGRVLSLRPVLAVAASVVAAVGVAALGTADRQRTVETAAAGADGYVVERARSESPADAVRVGGAGVGGAGGGEGRSAANRPGDVPEATTAVLTVAGGTVADGTAADGTVADGTVADPGLGYVGADRPRDPSPQLGYLESGGKKIRLVDTRLGSRFSHSFGKRVDLPLADADLTTAAWNRLREVDPDITYEAAVEVLRRARASARPGDEAYAPIGESRFREPRHEPLSTFSIDVDTASYSNVRRFLEAGQLPPPDAVRLEEMVNYFSYDDPAPEDGRPFATHVEVAGCPWNTANRLVRIGLRAKDVGGEIPPMNVVFLIDVSGSMESADKLPLLKRGMKLLAGQMREQDRVGIVTYASQSGVALPSTNGADRTAITGCIDTLSAGGSTNGGAGIQDAYRMAREHLVEGGVNRVVLATDGDFNVGVTDRGALVDLVRREAEGGVFLTVLGFGTGNIKDATLEQIADKGNGQYAYIDGLREARRVLVERMRGTLVTVAKDVKIQVEFNPARVASYRLLGYENRMLAAADFNDDAKDAGEIGSGHAVTALYEVVPVGAPPARGVDELRYQPNRPVQADGAASDELLAVKLRYKQPDGAESTKIEIPVVDAGQSYAQASPDLKFAASVAMFGMLLRNSPTRGTASYDAVLELGGEALGEDPGGYRAQFLDLVLKAKTLSGR